MAFKFKPEFITLKLNRLSPRLFCKNFMTIDVSTVNNQIDFMRSLHLVSSTFINNEINNPAEVEWEIFKPKKDLTVKGCSVLISRRMREICNEPLNNLMKINDHKQLNSNSDKEQCNIQNIVTDNNSMIQNKRKNVKRLDLCHNDLKSLKVLKFNKKSKNRIKRSSHSAQLTIKIGEEVVSTVYCKKKYLKDSNQIEDKVHEVQETNELDYWKQNHGIKFCLPTIEPSDPKDVRIHKMALALFEYEIRRKSNLNGCSSFYLNEKEVEEKEEEKGKYVEQENLAKEIDINHSNCDDAIVPDISHFNDKIQANFYTAETEKDAKELNYSNRQEVTFNSSENFGVITSDNNCDDFEDDCVIIHESLPNKNLLREQENSYIFHVSNDNDSTDALSK